MPLAHTALYTPRATGPLSIAALSNDRMLIVYGGRHPDDSDGDAIIGRIADRSTGTLAGGDFVVNTATQNHQYGAHAETAADGTVLVTWQPNSSNAILAQRFGADGARIGSEQTLIGNREGISGINALALAHGKVFVSWGQYASSAATYGGLYDATGAAMGTPTAYATNSLFFAVDATRFAGLRTTSTTDFTGAVNWLQFYSADTGAPIGAEINLGVHAGRALIHALGDGRLLQLTSSRGTGPNTNDSIDVQGQFLDAQGAPQGNAFVVNTAGATGSQSPQAVQALADGRFVVFWSTVDVQGNLGGEIRGQIFHANGSKFGGEILVDAHSYVRIVDKTFSVGTATQAFADGSFAIGWTAGDGAYISAFDELGTIATTTAHVQTTLTGTAGADTLAAAAGVRTRFVSQGGADQISGSSNIDTVVLDTPYASLQALGLLHRSDGAIVFTPVGGSAGTPATLRGVERIELKDTLLAYDTALPHLGVTEGGHVGQAFTLFSALTDRSPDRHELSVWVRKADELGSYNALAQNMVDTLLPGTDNAALVRLVGSNLLNTPVDEAFVAQFSAMVGTDKPFATAATLIAAAAALPLATDPLVTLVGGMQQLSLEVFAL
ncbi:hypothetical protein HNP48_006330 [Acidovorax soli]|uniref:DUF4214 domain-containing protein n=1 Tax=Acidovorax soli TaxID=592050 RepID=A0A7X0PKN4_9BURK|nr:hypothetical protein [Acidovorax soli]MBB6563606.1 hypothetical protein [Acidovorax soli]